MKKCVFVFAFLLAFIGVLQESEAQLLERVRNKVKETAEESIVEKSGNATEEAINNAEENVRNPDKKESKSTKTSENKATKTDDEKTEAVSKPSALGSFSNYDFVTGDKIIFYYDMADEKDKEIPGRMLINDGTAEIQSYMGEKVLYIPAKGNASMRPQMKNNNYLPEQYTLEFDILANGSSSEVSTLYLYFRKPEDAGRSWDGRSQHYIEMSGISSSQNSIGLTMTQPDGEYAGGVRSFPEEAVNEKQDNWRRVAIYVNKSIIKVYLDQHRIAVGNQVDPGAGMITFEIINDHAPVLIKNLRLASGGDDAYKKIITDGKFIAYGIQFDVNKAVLKPASMGTINEIASMLKKDEALTFEIGGHTDSDGAVATNNKLSQERADAVKNQLISMGIKANRLTTKGYGSSKPVIENNSAENKARNRRVEFVKL